VGGKDRIYLGYILQSYPDYIFLSCAGHTLKVSATRATVKATKHQGSMHGTVDQQVARRLAELRAHSNVSLAELARAIGVTKKTVWRYVHGKTHIPAERLEMMARAMHCKESDLSMPPGSPLPRLSFRPVGRQITPIAKAKSHGLRAPTFDAGVVAQTVTSRPGRV
jgi:transcriptional regulator with XRE-family HTH domain